MKPTHPVNRWMSHYKKELLILFASCAGCFLLGEALFAVIKLITKDETYFPLSTFTSLFASIGIIAIWGSYVFTNKFNLYVSLGMTRKAVLAEFVAFLMVSALAVWLCIKLCCVIEESLMATLWRATAEDRKVFPVTVAITNASWRILLVEGGIALLLGALTLKYGNKAWWIAYLVFIIGLQIPTLISDRLSPEHKAVAQDVVGAVFTGGGSLAPTVVSVLLCAVLSAAGVLVARKQQVSL